MQLSKHTLNLREGDYEYLSDTYGPNNIHASFVIRRIVSVHVDKLREREEKVEVTDVEIGDLNNG